LIADVASHESCSALAPAAIDYNDLRCLERMEPPFTWAISIDQLESNPGMLITSPLFHRCGKEWKGLARASPIGFLDVYVQKSDCDAFRAKFRLQLSGAHASLQPNPKESSHVFTTEDRGFDKIVRIDKLKEATPEATEFTIDIQIMAERKARPDDYSSKASTGYVGLKNQGATCYMNSLLQSLYHIPAFRQAVFWMPTQNDPKTETGKSSIGLALQRIFYHLQEGDKEMSTKKLTQSFGWDSADAFMQHDVQEFSRVLSDSLETKMKGTVVDGTIQKLFEGKSQMFIECVNVDFKSARTETYLDLSLNVKGCPNLEASLKQYIEVEKLEGDNQYRAEGHGLQDARKGTRFVSMPPVLQLQLKRFEYDAMADAMVKVNDRFEFPNILDVDQFLAEDAPNRGDPYYLHSVLVHSGSVHGGHYYSFIRPVPVHHDYKTAPFFKFDDETVSSASVDDLLQTFGGTATQVNMAGRTFMRSANAYMLVYIRKSELEQQQELGRKVQAEREKQTAEQQAKVQITEVKEAKEEEKKEDSDTIEQPQPVMDVDMATSPKKNQPPAHDCLYVEVPQHLLERFETERKQAEELAEKRRLEKLSTDIQVILESDLLSAEAMGFVMHSGHREASSGLLQYELPSRELRALKTESFRSWIEKAVKNPQDLPVNLAELQWWRAGTREKEHYRRAVEPLNLDKPITDLRSHCFFGRLPHRLDTKPTPRAPAAGDFFPKPVREIVLQFKFFNLHDQKYQYVGSLCVDPEMKLLELLRRVRELLLETKKVNEDRERDWRQRVRQHMLKRIEAIEERKKNDQDVAEDEEDIESWRHMAWITPGFKEPKDLVEEERVRAEKREQLVALKAQELAAKKAEMSRQAKAQKEAAQMDQDEVEPGSEMPSQMNGHAGSNGHVDAQTPSSAPSSSSPLSPPTMAEGAASQSIEEGQAEGEGEGEGEDNEAEAKSEADEGESEEEDPLATYSQQLDHEDRVKSTLEALGPDARAIDTNSDMFRTLHQSVDVQCSGLRVWEESPDDGTSSLHLLRSISANKLFAGDVLCLQYYYNDYELDILRHSYVQRAEMWNQKAGAVDEQSRRELEERRAKKKQDKEAKEAKAKEENKEGTEKKQEEEDDEGDAEEEEDDGFTAATRMRMGFSVSLPEFLTYLRRAVLVKFYFRPTHTEYTLELLRNWSYDLVVKELARITGYQDPFRLRLHKRLESGRVVAASVLRKTDGRLNMVFKMLSNCHEFVVDEDVYSLIDLETNRVLNITYMHRNLTTTEMEFLVPKNETAWHQVGDLIKQRIAAKLLEEEQQPQQQPQQPQQPQDASASPPSPSASVSAAFAVDPDTPELLEALARAKAHQAQVKAEAKEMRQRLAQENAGLLGQSLSRGKRKADNISEPGAPDPQSQSESPSSQNEGEGEQREGHGEGQREGEGEGEGPGVKKQRTESSFSSAKAVMDTEDNEDEANTQPIVPYVDSDGDDDKKEGKEVEVKDAKEGEDSTEDEESDDDVDHAAYGRVWRELRFLGLNYSEDIFTSFVTQMFRPTDYVPMSSNTIFRVEERPKTEQAIARRKVPGRILWLTSYYFESGQIRMTTPGPISSPIFPGETLAQVKARIQHRLGLSNERMAKVSKIGLIDLYNRAGIREENRIQDEDVLIDRLSNIDINGRIVLALEEPPSSLIRRLRTSSRFDHGIKINN